MYTPLGLTKRLPLALSRNQIHAAAFICTNELKQKYRCQSHPRIYAATFTPQHSRLHTHVAHDWGIHAALVLLLSHCSIRVTTLTQQQLCSISLATAFRLQLAFCRIFTVAFTLLAPLAPRRAWFIDAAALARRQLCKWTRNQRGLLRAQLPTLIKNQVGRSRFFRSSGGGGGIEMGYFCCVVMFERIRGNRS